MSTSAPTTSTRVDLDHAATTPPRPQTREALSRALEAANASAPHLAGQAARTLVEEAREAIATALRCSPHEVVFTSGGTEADNLAVKGIVWAARDRRPDRVPHLVVSAVEHPAVLAPARWLAERGEAHLDVVPPEPEGRVEVARVLEAVRRDTALVSVMTANNELGAVNDVTTLGAELRERGVPLHTDAVQAFATREVDAAAADALALSAHKFGGPQGVGLAVLRRGLAVEPLLHGGGQDRGVRSGTFATGLIAATAAAAAAVTEERPRLTRRLTALTDRLAAGATQLDGVVRNGPQDPAWRLASHVHLGLEAVDGAALALALDRAEVVASSGSACGSGAATASPVMAACGLDTTPLRLSLGWTSTEHDVDRALDVLHDVVPRLRRRTPAGVG